METEWVPLSIAPDQVNRSTGKEELYFYVRSAAAIDKLEFAYRLRTAVSAGA